MLPITWKQQQQEQQQLQKRQQQEQQLQKQQELEQPQVRVQAQLLPFCHRQKEQQQQRSQRSKREIYSFEIPIIKKTISGNCHCGDPQRPSRQASTSLLSGEL
jgi:hypothetical protein